MSIDILDIAVDHEIWRTAQSFNSISEEMKEVQKRISYIRNTMTNQTDLYEGKGKSEFMLFISAYEQNVEKLASYYQLCSMYMNETLNAMMEFDETLKTKFIEGFNNFEAKNPEEARKLMGGTT